MAEKITQARLKELLDYNPKTGVFRWRVTHRKIFAGMRAGGINAGGYWIIKIDNKSYSGHRLAWLYVYGRFPVGRLDHKNRDCACCRIANLREATGRQNKGNEKLRKDSLSGWKGVTWRGWQARITAPDGSRIQLGNFDTAEAAHAAYCKAAKKLFGEFFHSGRGK